jgi:hypothetical protein
VSVKSAQGRQASGRAVLSPVGYPVSLLVEAATGPLVDLFLALGERLVRSVAEPVGLVEGV